MPIIFFTAAASKQFHKLTSDAHFRAFTLFKNVNYDCSFPPSMRNGKILEIPTHFGINILQRHQNLWLQIWHFTNISVIQPYTTCQFTSHQFSQRDPTPLKCWLKMYVCIIYTFRMVVYLWKGPLPKCKLHLTKWSTDTRGGRPFIDQSWWVAN